MLLHLNGPPGIGKSTLAERYAAEHPGVLNLDIDRLRELVGGWQDRFAETGELVRPLALSMASTHLAAGHDVVMPQFLGNLNEIKRFEAAANAASAGFRMIVLMDDQQNSIDRFMRRGAAAMSPWHRHVRDVVERSGGSALLAGMHARLVEVIQRWPAAIVVACPEHALLETYDHVVTALRSPVSPRFDA